MGYTEDDVRLVAAAIIEPYDEATELCAERVLDALAGAGRLLPEDTRTEVSYGVRWPDGMISSDFLNAESARAYASDKTVLHPGQAVTRTVWVGSWVPVPEEKP